MSSFEYFSAMLIHHQSETSQFSPLITSATNDGEIITSCNSWRTVHDAGSYPPSFGSTAEDDPWESPTEETDVDWGLPPATAATFPTCKIMMNNVGSSSSNATALNHFCLTPFLQMNPSIRDHGYPWNISGFTTLFRKET